MGHAATGSGGDAKHPFSASRDGGDFSVASGMTFTQSSAGFLAGQTLGARELRIRKKEKQYSKAPLHHAEVSCFSMALQSSAHPFGHSFKHLPGLTGLRGPVICLICSLQPPALYAALGCCSLALPGSPQPWVLACCFLFWRLVPQASPWLTASFPKTCSFSGDPPLGSALDTPHSLRRMPLHHSSSFTVALQPLSCLLHQVPKCSSCFDGYT